MLAVRLDEGKACADERPLLLGLQSALYRENGALDAALAACRAGNAAQAARITAADEQIHAAEAALAACTRARDAAAELQTETENENRGLRRRLAGIEWFIWAVGSAAGAILLTTLL